MAGEPVNVYEFQELARQALPKMYYDYYTGGAEDQHTLKENTEAFHRITIDMSTTILGHKTSAPIMIAPTAMHKLAHPEGEVATARGAAACDVIMEVMSSSRGNSLLQKCEVYKRRDITALTVHRAEKNGFRAIILTADTPRLGRREADIKNKMAAPQLKNFEGLISTEYVSDKGSNIEAFVAGTFDASLCWKDIAWLKSITKLPILIKGVLTGEDECWLFMLFKDRGTDIFKIGRAVVYGLAAKGERGVKQVIQMLKNELELTMALSGCCSVDDITRSQRKKGSFVGC
ncbi:hypothetical protein RND71_017018 [Anisodus tanguticus]|uniref:FMN hydroxy acid dehydrogenase domain-containing protein n=1 Tax=Anisodus tanguticus TaxID=243964 RepID=A0AAE1VAL9_9SOLA|nr:hypothetical protein RND71_017018 [Anisodus tanguticus]